MTKHETETPEPSDDGAVQADAPLEITGTVSIKLPLPEVNRD